jgi:hypothetical protein
MKPAAEVIAPSGKTYDIPERAQVAQLFSKLAGIPDRKSIYSLRVDVIKTLVALAQQRENPVKLAAKRGLKSSATRKAKLDCYNEESPSLSEVNLKGHASYTLS